MLHGPHVLIVHHVFRPDDTRQTLDVGSLVPVHATALGKVLLANHQYLLHELDADRLDIYTPATVTDVARLHEEFRRIAERGWSSEVGELVPGTASIAAAIEDRGRLTQGAIGISGPTERLCSNGHVRTDLATYVVESARAISRELGAIPW
jgi:DNA-binding IclR family transcriptional regulator